MVANISLSGDRRRHQQTSVQQLYTYGLISSSLKLKDVATSNKLEWQSLPFQCCGQEQMPYHILQDCPLFEVKHQQTWPEDIDTQTELWET
jgi:hypothetical protein